MASEAKGSHVSQEGPRDGFLGISGPFGCMHTLHRVKLRCVAAIQIPISWLSAGERGKTHVDKDTIPIGYGTDVGHAVDQRPNGPGGPGLRYSKKTGDNRWVISREAVLNALDDMGSVLTSARLTPRVKNGAVEGFLVTEIKPRGIMDAVGLKNGDILKRVNGYEMTSPERAIQVLTALKGETSFDLDIVRNGRPESFHYEVR